MKTKFLFASAALVTCVLPIYADEKENSKPPASPSVKVNPQSANGPIDYSDYDSGFVQPLPKDKSDFTVKPPPGAVIQNPGRRKTPREVPVAPSSFALPKVPPISPLSDGDVRWRRGTWIVTSASLNNILQLIEQFYKVKIVTCSSPGKLVEDPKIKMSLSGNTADEKLDGLKVLGLAWRKIGDTYFVAWSETDLPLLQK